MQPHEQRVLNERDELIERLAKLDTFILTPRNAKSRPTITAGRG